MKIVSVVGARPQFIKAAPVSKALRKADHQEILVHTGQHYDYGMSKVFFEELSISEPDINLGIGSGPHGWQTGQMLMRIEEVLQDEKPDWVLVYGDTNSTLAGALSAVKLHIPLAHVEAGLRSFNREMPEEHNRVITDHCSDLLFCPTQTAVANLAKEGITHGVNLAGDTMYDAALQFAELSQKQSAILTDMKLKKRGYLLVTVHRPNNVDSPENLLQILRAFQQISEPIIFPVHPRTRKLISKFDLDNPQSNIQLIDPVGYLDMVMLEKNARVIVTDSGGVQKEAYFHRVPCVTLRDETEWVETVETGWNKMVGADKDKIVKAIKNAAPGAEIADYGNGDAALKIVRILKDID